MIILTILLLLLFSLVMTWLDARKRNIEHARRLRLINSVEVKRCIR